MNLRSIARATVPFLLAAAAGEARAQAPRETAEATIGAATIRIEYGSPPWNEERREQIDSALPVGAVWRLGADRRTTLVVGGGPVLIGGALLEPGGYGLNIRRTAEKEWSFVVFDGADTSVQLEDPAWEAPARVEEKAGAAPERLVVGFADAGGQRELFVRWGPLQIAAPVAPVAMSESEIEIGGEQASSRWFACAAADAPGSGAWTLAGIVSSFYVGDVDCGIDVDLRLDGGAATVRFTNRERAKVADRLSRVEAALAALERSAAGAAPGSAARRFAPRRRTLDEAKTRLSEELEGLAANPAPFEVAVPLAPAKTPSGRVAATLVRRGGSLAVVVEAGDRGGEAAVDEARLLPAPGPKD